MNNLKRKTIFISIIFLLLTAFCKAQHNEITIASGSVYGTDIKEAGLSFGIGFTNTHHLSLGTEVSFFPKHKLNEENISLFELNVLTHYIVDVNKHLMIYPLIGINYSVENEEKHEVYEHTKAFGLDVGAGIHYKLNHFIPFFEYKDIIGLLHQHTYSVGIMYSIESHHKNEIHNFN